MDTTDARSAGERIGDTTAMPGNREHVYHAVMLDPLTGALLTLAQIRAMVDESVAAGATCFRRSRRDVDLSSAAMLSA